MCAAPGSKTAQMVDIMHEKAGSSTPEGVVIANDVDERRCYLMIHQVNRLSSPIVMATQIPAQKFPFLSIDSLQNPSVEEVPIFDRVLADVPCSGDGTFRKNYDLWPKWTTALGLGLHKFVFPFSTNHFLPFFCFIIPFSSKISCPSSMKDISVLFELYSVSVTYFTSN